MKAVAFDAFPVLDPRPVFALAENLFPGKGADFAAAWRTRQFEYTWLHSIAPNMWIFGELQKTLVFAAKLPKLSLAARGNQRVRLMDAYLAIRCWPEAPAALRALKEAGIRLAFLSNMTQEMLEAGIRNSGLERVFDHVLSTDRVAAFKPDPRAYQMGIDAFGLRRKKSCLPRLLGGTRAGARVFGNPPFWVKRQVNKPAEELG